jgi:hypothetical protein
MIRRPLVTPVLIVLATAGLLIVSACGKQGKLDQPAPLFGAEAKAAYAAKKQAEADAAAKAAEAKVVTPQPLTPKEIEAAPAATPN